MFNNGGRRVLIWDCFKATGLGHHEVTESTMNSSIVYQSIFKSNVRPSVTDKAWKKSAHERDDPNHSSKSTTEWLKNKIIKMLQWLKVQASTPFKKL